MLNIFNLFLFLLLLWAMFMLAAGHLTWLYLVFGVIASALVSLVSMRLKLIEKNSELLYLSLGFYRHFFMIFVNNFLSSLFLIINLAFRKKDLRPTLHRIKLGANLRFNPALLMASFNMSTGLICVGVKENVKENEMLIHAIDPSYFKKCDFQKICLNLRNINDDNLI